jgi:ribosomal protein L7/L12
LQQIEVKVENDHIERVTTAKPLAAISELIWNAYDADATEVRVVLQSGRLTKLGAIHVIDNGSGIPLEKAETLFQSLGGSWKKLSPKTDAGRMIHGSKGQGRFKAFALGDRVSWWSRHGGKSFSISGDRADLKRFALSDDVSDLGTGCRVEIDNIVHDFKIYAEDGFAEQVQDYFALQLYEDPNFRIIYDGQEIDARKSIESVTPYQLVARTDSGQQFDATIEIVEWKKKVDRKVMLCLPGRFSFHAMAAGIHARGFDFTAYLTSDHFQTLADDNTEGLVELDPPSVALVEAAKNKLREHFRKRESERSRSKIRDWKEAKIYPYEGNPSSAIEVNERQVFDVVALNLADYSPDFEKTSDKQQKLVLQLIKAAVETGPSALPSILEKVVDLPKAKQEELADLLRKTSLTAVINAAKAVTDRLEFLRALQILVFNPNSKRQLLERSQLHRIIAQETWIFGEQFNLMNDDEDLTGVLRSHMALLGRDRQELVPTGPVLDAEGKPAIVDLMLSCRMPTPTDYDRRHLVVELKRPAQTLNEEVINQIKKYAKAVALEERFNHSKVEWDFVVISNKFTKDAELEARQANKPRGLVLVLDEPVKIRVWARTWGEIIQDAEGRLTFYKRRLEYQASDTEALRYLQTINADYLSDEVKERISALGVEPEPV